MQEFRPALGYHGLQGNLATELVCGREVHGLQGESSDLKAGEGGQAAEPMISPGEGSSDCRADGYFGDSTEVD
jgi:hypothetical protein